MLLVKKSLIRAVRSFCQSLAATIPAGVVITPALIQGLGWPVVYIIIAWIGTAFLHGLSSFLTCIVAGIPEAEEGKHYE